MRAMSALAISVLCVAITAPSASAQNSDLNPPTNNASNAWNICNETSYVLRIAVAGIRDGKMTPRGWNQLRPGACQTENLPPNSPRYVFAESSPVHMGRVREWKGKVKLCADTNDFTADATRSCALQDLQTRDYLQVDPTERNTRFIEPDNFGENADTAGLQRLLRDNGYKISRVDGLPGRRTSRTLDTFLKDQDLSKPLSMGEKFDALIKAAKERQDSIGLKICNSTDHTVWAAVAFLEDAEFQSRGWWSVDKDACVRPITTSLINSEAHIFALQEQPKSADDDTQPADKRLRTVAAKPVQFCVSDGIFSAIGNELCEDRGYTPVSFRPVATDMEGTTITLSDADFTMPSTTGLRR